MFQKIQDDLQRWNAERVDDFLGNVNDPVALKAGWSIAGRFASSEMATHSLVQVSPTRLEYRTSGKAKVFLCFLLIAGGGLLGCGVAVATGRIVNGPSWLPLVLFGFAMIVVPVLQLYRGIPCMCFDIRKGIFWRGNRKSSAGLSIPLEAVHAVQLLVVLVHRNGRRRRCYEINLVTKEGSRIHILGHGEGVAIQSDARLIASSLAVPLWDATGFSNS